MYPSTTAKVVALQRPASAADLPPGQPLAPPGDPTEMLLAGAIGETLSTPLAEMQKIVEDVGQARGISELQLAQLEALIASARRIAMQSQQICRLASGRLRQSHEKLGLDEVLHGVLDQRARSFKLRGIELYRNIKPVGVIVDAGLLNSVVESAVDWASEEGQRLVVSLEIKNWPEHGVLWIKASEGVAQRDAKRRNPAEVESLNWYLLKQIAQSMGVAVTRVEAPGEVTLTLEFSRTVRQLEGMTAVEVDTQWDSLMPSESKQMAGHRLLLVTRDEALRGEVKNICRGMALVLDTVPGTAQAIRFCEMDKPHLILMDERLRDPNFDELLADMRRYDANLPFVEITNQPDLLEMASWVNGSLTRVSRDSVRNQLGTLIVFELAKVM
jgi:hypothetical protein